MLSPHFSRKRYRESSSSSSSKEDRFVRLVGTYLDQRLEHIQSDHLLLDIQVLEERYTAAVNIHSRDGSDVSYVIFDQKTTEDLPMGVTENVTLSYRELGLRQDDFSTVHEQDLYIILSSLARSCSKIIIYGYLYQDGEEKGIHDIHMNCCDSNWTKWKNRPSDGIIGFVYPNHIQWVAIKFSTQYLPDL